MKKCIYVILAVICLLSLVGCTNRSLNYIISNVSSYADQQSICDHIKNTCR